MRHHKPRTIVYVDGFNLYYGAVRGTPHKWLNLERFFRLLRPADDIQVIRYFTALVTGPTRPNQEIFLKALATLPLVDVVLGKFMSKNVKCSLTTCTHSGTRLFATHEEKRTDVNIAVSMLDDVYQNLCDRLILVSGDSDLVPALQLARRRFPEKETIVYVPARNRKGFAYELRTAAHKNKDLPLNLLAIAQFPAQLPDGFGGTITKPSTW